MLNGGNAVECSRDPSHQDLSLRDKRCRICGGGLQRKCPGCCQDVSYSNFAKHVKACKNDEIGGDGRTEEVPIRLAYVQAEWDPEVGLEAAGVYRGPVDASFPSHFRSRVVRDPTGDDVLRDVYDAVIGNLLTPDGRFVLVHTFRSLEALSEDLTANRLPEADVLIISNWALHTALKNNVEQLLPLICTMRWRIWK